MSRNLKRQWRTARARARPSPGRRPGGIGPGNRSRESLVSQALHWVALLLPPTTLLTALAFWFGWTLTDTRSSYFGIDASTLEFTTVDYVLRSADALIVPGIMIGFLLLLGLGVHGVVWRLLSRSTGVRAVRRAAWATAALGFAGVVVGVNSLFTDPLELRGVHYLAQPVVLGGGAVCLAYGWFVVLGAGTPSRPGARRSPPGEGWVYAALGLLMVLSLFWATTLYAAALGRGRAETIARDLERRPAAIVYSDRSLELGGPVTTERIGTDDSRYRYRYSGLRLLVRSADKHFLLPDGWTRADGTAIIIDDDPSVRIELKPGRP